MNPRAALLQAKRDRYQSRQKASEASNADADTPNDNSDVTASGKSANGSQEIHEGSTGTSSAVNVLDVPEAATSNTSVTAILGNDEAAGAGSSTTTAVNNANGISDSHSKRGTNQKKPFSRNLWKQKRFGRKNKKAKDMADVHVQSNGNDHSGQPDDVAATTGVSKGDAGKTA
jgi:hypothetical protein